MVSEDLAVKAAILDEITYDSDEDKLSSLEQLLAGDSCVPMLCAASMKPP